MGQEEQTEASQFDKLYSKVLEELDVLHRGVYDPTEAVQTAALCLLSQAPLIRIIGSAELRAKSLKRDVEFEKAQVYLSLKKDPPSEVKKLTEETLKQLVTQNKNVQKLILDQAQAEKEVKELINILALIRDAHITFRTVSKGE